MCTVDALSNVIVSAREEASVGVIGVRGLIVRGDLSVVVLSVLHKVVRVNPVVEHQHMVRRQQNRISFLHFAARNASADVLHVVCSVASSTGTALPGHRNHARAITAIPIGIFALRVRNASVDPVLSAVDHLIAGDFARGGWSTLYAAL